MRHITGIAKIDPVVEFVEDFLEETERKIVIFVHHKDVASSILNRLKALDGILDNNEILSLTSDLSPEQRDEVVQKFWSAGYRSVSSKYSSFRRRTKPAMLLRLYSGGEAMESCQ